ncbi:Manganese peroxidase 2 [Bienertia sinuspersici]
MDSVEGLRRGRGEASLSNTSSSDLNHSISSNSISLSHSNSNSHSNQHQQRQQHHNHHQGDPMQSWWESVSKARSRIQALLNLLPVSTNDSLSSLADSDRPARSLLDSYEAYSIISSSLSGSGDDPLCQWLYDTFLESSDDSESDLRLVVVSLVPLIAGLYLSRIHAFSTTSPTVLGSPSLAGFEAVLLALYSYETKVRAGKPLLVSIPSPTYLNHHPSLYHTPTPQPSSHNNNNSYSRSSSSSPTSGGSGGIGVGVISPPLEPQMGIKSTKRASIVGVALHCFFKHISQMPPWSKIDLCRFAASWAGDDCPCALSLDFHSTAPNTTNQRDDDDDVVSVREELAVSLTTISPNGSLDSQHATPHQNGGEIILSEDLSRVNVNGTHSQNSHTVSEEQELEQVGVKIPLPWELLQPLLRILGHCLLAPPPLITQEMKDAASVAVRRLYARASHDLVPQAILATRSLVQLDNRARATAKAAAFSTVSSNSNTPKSKKPEVLLVSK